MAPSLPRSFTYLAGANFAAQSAEQLSLAAAPIVAVLLLGAGPGEIGFLATAQTLPFLLMSIPLGLVADRTSRARLMRWAEAVRMLALLALLAAVLCDRLSIGLLAVLGFVGAVGTVAFSVAAPAIVPALVPREAFAQANGRLELVRSAAFAAGPALAGALVAWAGASAAFILASVLSAAAVILLLKLVEPPRTPAPARRPLAALREGAALVWRDAMLRPILLTAVAWNISWFVLQVAYVPYAMRMLGLSVGTVGITLASYGAGMVVGALLAPRVVAAMPFGRAIQLGPAVSVLAAAAMLLTLVFPFAVLAALAFFLFGAGPIIWTITSTTLRQTVTPGAMLGRVSAMFLTVNAGSRPVGAALGGLVGAWWGEPACLFLASAGFVLQAALIFGSQVRTLRQLPAGTSFARHLVHKTGCLKMVHEGGPRPGAAQGPIDGLAAEAWIARLDPPLHGAATGPLAGLRFAAKDNIDAAGVPTTAACPAFARTPAVHAQVVQRLLDAGASLLGKTNLDQFACGLNGTRSPYGAVPNSFDARYVSGGSSSGSAYVVATGQADFALGTDTAGSGRVPAGLNNIVGLKPSRGLIGARGVVPAAQSVDCVSIFARTVDVAARVLQAAMGLDAEDPYSRRLTLATQALPARFRFGVPSALRFFGDPLSASAFERAIQQMRALGGTPVTIDYAPLAAAAALLYDSALVAERYAAVREFFDTHEAEVIEPVRSILAQGRNYSAADFVDARTRLHALGQRAAAMWDGIDVLLVPTAPTHCTIAAMQADPVARNRELGEYTNFVNLLDYAAISVPSSLREDRLPFGITLIGRCGSDFQLAELGQRYHHATGLALGATGEPMPAPAALPVIAPQAAVEVAVVGAHLSGMPLNAQLTERGARLRAATETAPIYRLYALPGTAPPKPGLVRVAPGEGAAIAVELWEMPLAHYGSFVALVPAPLGIGRVVLADGRSVQGFLCEGVALAGATDITHLGGWRAYIAAQGALA